MHELIRDITLCILFAWVLGLLAHFSRQPLILAYLIAGFFIGPFGMGWVKSQESINVISELGLIFMLFMIGLEIDLKKIVRAGKVILFAAGGQLIGGGPHPNFATIIRGEATREKLTMKMSKLDGKVLADVTIKS